MSYLDETRDREVLVEIEDTAVAARSDRAISRIAATRGLISWHRILSSDV